MTDPNLIEIARLDKLVARMRMTLELIASMIPDDIGYTHAQAEDMVEAARAALDAIKG